MGKSRRVAQGRVENGIPTLLGDAGRGRNRPADPFFEEFSKNFSAPKTPELCGSSGCGGGSVR